MSLEPCSNCIHESLPGYVMPCLECTPRNSRFEARPPSLSASDLLRSAADLIQQRGTERDQDDGERSMARCVKAFNAMTGHNLTEEDGWQFMVYLKHARMRGGGFKQDDYEDAVAYSALQAECAINADSGC